MKTVTCAGVILSMVIASTSASIQSAVACGCYGGTSVEEAMTDSTAVFAGKVVTIEEIKRDNSAQGDWKVQLEVQKSWKGASVPEVVLTIPGAYRFLLHRFKLGAEYLVYATDDRSEAGASAKDNAEWLTLDLCSRTRPLANAAADMSELGDSLWQSPQSRDLVRMELTRRFAELQDLQKTTAQRVKLSKSEVAQGKATQS